MKVLSIIAAVVFSLQLQGQISHQQWDSLLKMYVSPDGKVNYKGFVKDKAHLNAYLEMVSNNPPKSTWSKNEKLAYWINAYNAFTVQLIVKHYPLKSIKDIGGDIYKVNTPWDIKFVKIGNETINLSDLEHMKIRAQFHEPRIHFAVNCASVSCPRLRDEAFTADRLEEQLDDQTRYFFNRSGKNDLSNPNAPKLSKILSWYSGDFEMNGQTVIGFINKYSNKKVNSGAKLDFLEYNWNLNE